MAEMTGDLARIIGRRMARLRIARGESQEEVSLRAGINRTAVGQLERGERVPRADTLVKVAGALEVDPGVMIAKLAWKPITYNAGSFQAGDIDIDQTLEGGA